MPALIRPASVVALGAVVSLATSAAARSNHGPQAVVINQGPPLQQGAAAPTVGTGVVSGVVIDAQTHEPIPGAVVYIGLDGRGRVGQQSRQVTDSRGRFVFVEVPASDRLTVSASRVGYLDGGYSRTENVGAVGGQLAIAEGQWVGDVRLELSKRGSISGAVIDEQGEPVVGVYVRVLAALRIAGRDRLAAGPAATTDDRGMYRIPTLAPGRYLVSVPSVQASVPASATSAQIAGLTDERIAASRTRGQAPEIPVEQAVGAGEAVRVVVGPYPLAPPPMDGRSYAYPITFYPGSAAVRDAVPIELGFGDHRGQIDIRLTPLPASRVSGRVDGPPEAWTNLTLRLLASGLEELGLGSETATALVAPDGTFRFANVPAGIYTVEAPTSVSEYQFSQSSPFGRPFGRPPGVRGSASWSDFSGAGPPGTMFMMTTLDGPRAMSGRAEIAVGGTDVSDVVVPLRGAARVSGHVRFEFDPNQPQPAQPPGLSVMAEPANGSPMLGLPRANADRNDPTRAFALEGLLPGRYLLRAPLGLDWRIKSITYGGRDYTYVPFDTTTAQAFDGVVITVTNAVASIIGSVRDGQGAPAVGARVIVFPFERAQWTQFGLAPPRIRSAMTTNLGTYRIGSLPAGDYYVVAVPDARRTDWRDPAFFVRAAALAAHVTVGWGEARTQDLTATAVRQP